MPGRSPSWESRLWSYLGHGDGRHCPMADGCLGRQRQTRCADVNQRRLSQMIASDSDFNPDTYDHPRPCRGGLFPLVEKLAEGYLRRGRADHVPVPTELVALADDGNSIEVRTLDLRTCYAATWRLDDGWVIQVAEMATPPRSRISLFHEAFHIMAHSRSDTTPVFGRRGATQGSFNELLADYFAICVLMPREWVEREWAELKDVGRMAETFDVPESTMWLRLKELDLVE